ncbi:MAG TPA: type II secretion system F family protein [Terriglobales bacterium]|nr:type II secretion system F family protein [Terriglobales bacterium]
MVYLVVLGLFILVVILVFTVAGVFEERDVRARSMRERLLSLERAQERGPSEELALLREEILSEIPALNRVLQQSPRIRQLQRFLDQADTGTRAGKFLMISLALAMIFGALAMEWSNIPTLGLAMALLGGLMPYFYYAYRRARRFQKFEEMFPEAIELLSRATRAGHAFTTAIELIGNELGEPVAGEFRKLFEEQKYGLPVRDALLNLGERVPLVDVKFFITTVMLQRETGGNLAEILDKLSYLIRERFKILRQVRVYTAQGRLTLLILMLLPPGVVLMFAWMDYKFIEPLWTDPIGHALIAAGVVMQTIGFFLIRKIIRIRV